MTVEGDYLYWIREYAGNQTLFFCKFAQAFLVTTELGHLNSSLYTSAGNGDAPSACTETSTTTTITPTTTTTTTELWSRYNKNNRICQTGASTRVSDRGSCQELAVGNRHAFYQFKSNGKRCVTSSTCFLRQKKRWKIYRAPLPDVWPRYGAKNRRCVGNSSSNIKVVDRANCQTLAFGRWHPFYEFKASGKRCVTASSCSLKRASKWRVYRAPESL